MAITKVDNTEFPAYFRIQTPPETITLPDGDVMIFFTEVLQNEVQESTEGYGMAIRNERGDLVYSDPIKPDFPSTYRHLLYQTNRNGYVRWVPYIFADDPDSSSINELVNVFSPKITYNPKNGKLTMVFWINVYYSSRWEGAPTEPTDWGDLGFGSGATSSTPDTVSMLRHPYWRRVLCSAEGFLYRGNVDGGEVEAHYPDAEEQNDDYIPIFLKPKIIYSYRAYDDGDNEEDFALEGQWPVIDSVARQGVVRAFYAPGQIALSKYSVVETRGFASSSINIKPVEQTGTTQYGVLLQDVTAEPEEGDSQEVWVQVSGICPVRVDKAGFRFTPTAGENRAMHNFLGPIHTLYYNGYMEYPDGGKIVIAELTKQRGDNWMIGTSFGGGVESAGYPAAVIYFDFDTAVYDLSVRGARGSLLVDDV